MSTNSKNNNESSGDTTQTVLVGAASGVIGYLLGKKMTTTNQQLSAEQVLVVPAPLPTDQVLANSDIIGYYPQSYMDELVFRQDIEHPLHPFTADILFVDAIYSAFRDTMMNRPNMDERTKKKLTYHACNLISGLACNAYSLEVAAAVLVDYSPSQLLVGSNLVQPVAPVYRQPYGVRRRRLDSRRIDNVIKKLTHNFNDYLNKRAYDTQTGQLTEYSVGSYVGLNPDKNYRDHLHAQLLAGTLALPPVDNTHHTLRLMVKERSQRRMFINRYNRMLIIDYPSAQGEDNMFSAIFEILFSFNVENELALLPQQ